ncbi:alpha,alpha-trehalose-phosphate synthase [UDP-forming] 6 [Tanacetum coccineum]
MNTTQFDPFAGANSSNKAPKIKTGDRCSKWVIFSRPTKDEKESFLLCSVSHHGTLKTIFTDLEGQEEQGLDKFLGLDSSRLKKSMLVVSEFIGCSPSLSGAIRVNPWDIDSFADAMDNAKVPIKRMRN